MSWPAPAPRVPRLYQLTPAQRRSREVRALARALRLEMERQDAAGYRDWGALTLNALAAIDPLNLL